MEAKRKKGGASLEGDQGAGWVGGPAHNVDWTASESSDEHRKHLVTLEANAEAEPQWSVVSITSAVIDCTAMPQAFKNLV